MPRNKYPEETVAKILEVSEKLFVEKGYEQTTIINIIDNLGGLSRGAFYHHFKHKQDVLYAVSERLFVKNRLLREAILKLRDENGMSGLDKIKKALVSAERATSTHEIKSRSINRIEYLLSQPHFFALYAESNMELSRMMEPLVAQGMVDGSIRPSNPKILSELFIQLMNFWLMPNIYPCDEKEVVAKMEMMKQIFDMLGFPIMDEIQTL